MTKKNRLPIDTGTPEMSNRHIVKPELISQRSGKAMHLRVQDQREIDRLLLKDKITIEQHQALEAFQADAYFAGLEGVRAQDYGRVMGSGTAPQMTNREAMKRLKVSRCLARVDRDVPPVRHGGVDTASALLLRTVLDDAPVPEIWLKKLSDISHSLQRFYSHWRGG